MGYNDIPGVFGCDMEKLELDIGNLGAFEVPEVDLDVLKI